MKGKKAPLEPVPELPDFLAPLAIEIGVEEMPAGAMPGVLAYLKESAAAFLEKEHLEPSHLFVGGTCRRLVVTCDSILKIQEDRLVIHKGPPEKVLRDAAGNWTPQAEGFAKKFGLKAADIVMEDGYATIEILERGQPATVLLGRFVREFLDKCPLPKRMAWGDDVTFLRPVRWVLGLVGVEVIQFATRKLKAGHTTHEPRQNRSKPLSFLHAGEYAENMKLLGVELCPERRKERLRHLALHALEGTGLKPLEADQEELLEEINWLVETPHALLASFDKTFLEVPPEVIRVVLMRHQRYLPLVEKSRATPANYANRFVVVLDRQEESDTTTAMGGHERVVTARLSDALFFWRADSAEPLDSPHRQEKLKDITFHPKIGSLWEKQMRVAGAAKAYQEKQKKEQAIWFTADLSDERRRQLENQLSLAGLSEAAALYRQDRTTTLVGEFPELEGAVGARLLMQRTGQNAAAVLVAEAMGLTRQGADKVDQLVFSQGVPSSRAGVALLMLDRLDTLLHFFALGLVPSATEDPFGLRRSAAQVLRTTLRWNLDAIVDLDDVMEILRTASQSLGDLDEQVWRQLKEKIHEFLKDRFPHVLLETYPRATMPFVHAAQKGKAVKRMLWGDSEREILQAVWRYSDVPDRLKALLDLAADSESFKAIASAAIRVQNISQHGTQAEILKKVPDWVCGSAPWLAMHEFALKWIDLVKGSLFIPASYLKNAGELAYECSDVVNDFFDKVLVNDEDPQRRKDNHTLVGAVALLYGTLGDFRELKSLLGQE